MQFRFTFLSGANAQHVETAESTPILLGRDDGCHIRFDKLKDLSVSGQHARIEMVGEGEFTITNLSKNGVLVNGFPIEETARLPNHATVTLGKDGPRVRFDMDDRVMGVSRTDVQRKTAKLRRDQVQPTKSPDTEERPVFKIEDIERPKRAAGMSLGTKALLAAAAVSVVVLIVVSLALRHH